MLGWNKRTQKNDRCRTIADKNGGSIPCIKLTAGDDQLPQESAKVTNGSDNSNPKFLLAVNSAFLYPLWRSEIKTRKLSKFKTKHDLHEGKMDVTHIF